MQQNDFEGLGDDSLYKYIWGIISNVEKLLRDNMEIDQIDINQSWL